MWKEMILQIEHRPINPLHCNLVITLILMAKQNDGLTDKLLTWLYSSYPWQYCTLSAWKLALLFTQLLTGLRFVGKFVFCGCLFFPWWVSVTLLPSSCSNTATSSHGLSTFQVCHCPFFLPNTDLQLLNVMFASVCTSFCFKTADAISLLSSISVAYSAELAIQ